MGKLLSIFSNPDTFITDCEKVLIQLDDALLGLASSVDNVHLTVKLLLNQLEDLDSHYSVTEEKRSAIVLVKELLENIEHSLFRQKYSSLQWVSMFIKMIREYSVFKTIMQKIPTAHNLSIDEYLTDFVEKQIARAHGQRTTESDDKLGRSVDPEKPSEGGDGMLESLRSKLDELDEKLRKSNEDLDQRDATIRVLEKEVEDMKRDLSKQLETKVLPVQLYYPNRGDLINQIQEELLIKLEKRVARYNKDLDVVICETSDQIEPNIPLLILCISSSRLGTDAANAIHGVLQKENTALLIFHHKDEHALPNQASDRVLTGPGFKALRGIYDLAFLTEKGIYACKLNSNAIMSIVDFIYEASN